MVDLPVPIFSNKCIKNIYILKSVWIEPNQAQLVIYIFNRRGY